MSRNRSASVQSRMMSLHSMPLPSRPSCSASSRSRKMEPLPFSPADREEVRALSRASERRAIGLKSNSSEEGSDPVCPESDDPYMLRQRASLSPNKCPVQVTSGLPKQPRGRGNFNQSQQINLREIYGKMGKKYSGSRGSSDSKPAQSDFPQMIDNPLSIGERMSKGEEQKSRVSKLSYCSAVSRSS
mmetsp:Transcript_21851/g.33856  ORF Transcript_21851/g.33856 Transcript_21851/m.33856 type:complete len:187 (-) Transcript_21851:1964-2524(-)